MVVFVMFFIGNILISFYHIKLNGITFPLRGLKNIVKYHWKKS